ncbi:MAG: YegS/Rv2252/BmrU family lipid kinase [Parachlamydiales bacterium]
MSGVIDIEPSIKEKIYFIINPKSGTSNKKNIEKLIHRFVDVSKYHYEIEYTHGPNHATSLSAKAVELGYNIIVGVGGDGTINEVAKGLINTTSILGIIPCGSGNGVANHLKIPKDPILALKLINRSTFSIIDTVNVNDKFFLGIAGIGFDAHIAGKFANMKKRGFLSYAKLVLLEFFKYKSNNFELIIDGDSINKEGFLLSFAKSTQYGNDIKIAPLAKIDDGHLQIAILKYPPFYAILDIILKLKNGSIHKSKYYETIKCKTLMVKNYNTLAHLDGEPHHFEGQMDFKVFPKSLKIITPRHVMN